MGIFSFLFSQGGKILPLIMGAFSLFLMGRNSRLSKENDALNSDVKNQELDLLKKSKVIDVIKNTKSTDIDGNIDRMRKGGL
jgi:hypothetical protein